MVGQAVTIVATPTGPISPARTPRWDAGGERGRQKKRGKGICGELGGGGVLGTTGSEADNSTLEMSRLRRLVLDIESSGGLQAACWTSEWVRVGIQVAHPQTRGGGIRTAVARGDA